MADKQTIYDSTGSLFEETGPREAFKSNLFKGLMLQISPMTSYRNGAFLLNRMRRVDNNGIIETTFRNSVEREGESIKRCIEEKTSAAVDAEGLSISSIKPYNYFFHLLVIF